VQPLFERYLYDPVVTAARWLARLARPLQFGIRPVGGTPLTGLRRCAQAIGRVLKVTVIISASQVTNSPLPSRRGRAQMRDTRPAKPPTAVSDQGVG
jgi:hypothetical protein